MPKPKNRNEFRTSVADMFAHILEEKGLEWTKEWNAGELQAPYNAITGKHYRGVNSFFLTILSMAHGITDPRWMTMVQIMDKKHIYHPNEKWHLKAGTKAEYVEYWFPSDNGKAITWEKYREELRNGREAGDFDFYPRYYAVFNAQDVEGIAPIELGANHNEITPDELIHKISNGMGVEILNDGGSRAFYRPSEDKIHLPLPEYFESDYAYNATALHELGHSTGHESRLNRNIKNAFGSPEYAFEELIAEMSSCFMSFNLNLTPSQSHIDNHKAYVQNWIKEIKEKPEKLMSAIKEAQNAASYMENAAGLITDKELSEIKDSSKSVDESSIVKAKEPREITIEM